MRNFEHRVALPKVLDQIHRKTLTETLGRCGLKVSGESWQEIDDTLAIHPDIPEYLEEYDLDGVEYGDDEESMARVKLWVNFSGSRMSCLRARRRPILTQCS